MLPPLESTSPVWLVCCWLASWRISSLLAFEAGPFDLFSHMRTGLARLGLGGLISCFHCLAVWVSTVIVLLAYELHPRSALLTLAVAGGVSLVERALDERAASGPVG